MPSPLQITFTSSHYIHIFALLQPRLCIYIFYQIHIYLITIASPQTSINLLNSAYHHFHLTTPLLSTHSHVHTLPSLLLTTTTNSWQQRVRLSEWKLDVCTLKSRLLPPSKPPTRTHHKHAGQFTSNAVNSLKTCDYIHTFNKVSLCLIAGTILRGVDRSHFLGSVL